VLVPELLGDLFVEVHDPRLGDAIAVEAVHVERGVRQVFAARVELKPKSHRDAITGVLHGVEHLVLHVIEEREVLLEDRSETGLAGVVSGGGIGSRDVENEVVDVTRQDAVDVGATERVVQPGDDGRGGAQGRTPS